MNILTKFTHLTDDDRYFVGRAEISAYNEVNILSCWEHLQTESPEVFPYAKDFPYQLRCALERAALESVGQKGWILLPDEWEPFQVVSQQTIYDIDYRGILADVKTDQQAQFFGLSSVRRVHYLGGGKYRVTAKGSFDEVKRDIQKISR